MWRMYVSAAMLMRTPMQKLRQKPVPSLSLPPPTVLRQGPLLDPNLAILACWPAIRGSYISLISAGIRDRHKHVLPFSDGGDSITHPYCDISPAS